MEGYCRLCAEEKPSHILVYSITDEMFNIEQKLFDCCRWNLFTLNGELPEKICCTCFEKLENSWSFVESVGQAQDRLLALITDVKPDLSGFEYVNASVDTDEVCESTEEIKHLSYPNIAFSNFENDSTSSTSVEHNSDLSTNRCNEQNPRKIGKNSRSLRHVLLRHFKQEKSAAVTHRLILKTYGKSPSVKTCEFWFRRFRMGNFNLEDKERPGQPKKFKDIELRVLVDENPSQSSVELAEIFGVSKATIFKRLYAIGKFFKDGKWVARESSVAVKSADVQPKNSDVERKQILDIIQNKKLHRKSISWLCETCGKKFSRPEQLKRHTLIHQNKTPFVCKTCGKGFCAKFNLRVKSNG